MALLRAAVGAARGTFTLAAVLACGPGAGCDRESAPFPEAQCLLLEDLDPEPCRDGDAGCSTVGCTNGRRSYYGCPDPGAVSGTAAVSSAAMEEFQRRCRESGGCIERYPSDICSLPQEDWWPGIDEFIECIPAPCDPYY